MQTIGNITLGGIKNVRKSGDEEGLYCADVEFSPSEGFPMETVPFIVRASDPALTGKWVYQQIIDGNFEGPLVQHPPGVDIETGQVPEAIQPVSQGAQTL